MNAFTAGKRHIHDAISMIHDVIRRANPFPYTVKLMFVGARNNKTKLIIR